MSIFSETLILELQNEHVLEHGLITKKKFSVPKIYTAKGDLSKRWYVYFSFRNPKTKKLERMKNIYGKANTFKTKADRLTVLTAYRSNLLELLKAGHSPFENKYLGKEDKNSQLGISNKQKVVDEKTKGVNEIADGDDGMPLQVAFDFALKLKENQVKQRTIQDYGYKTKAFLLWLAKVHPEIKTINNLSKKILLDFLNYIVMKSSTRNRNNFRLALGSILQTLEENEIISFNNIKNIKVLKSVPKRNKTFSEKTENDIFKHLEKADPILLLYIKFVSYNFLRPVEVSRLKVSDFNLNDKTITFQAKNSHVKKKIIPDILWRELPDLSKMTSEHLFFTPDKLGGVWKTTETNRRNYFSKRFKEKVKTHFNLGIEYGLYSFRHTYITKLYRQLLKEATPFEAKSRLMLITGHNSMSALEKYLRDTDAELAKDYSHLLK